MGEGRFCDTKRCALHHSIGVPGARLLWDVLVGSLRFALSGDEDTLYDTVHDPFEDVRCLPIGCATTR